MPRVILAIVAVRCRLSVIVLHDLKNHLACDGAGFRASSTRRTIAFPNILFAKLHSVGPTALVVCSKGVVYSHAIHKIFVSMQLFATDSFLLDEARPRAFGAAPGLHRLAGSYEHAVCILS